MAGVPLGQDNFQDTIEQNEIVFVDFWAEWCGPCKMFAPIYEQAAKDHPDIVFGSVDTEAEFAFAGAAGISAIPTLMAFKDGELVFRQSGALPAPVFADLVQAVRDLDLEAEKAKQEAAASAES